MPRLNLHDRVKDTTTTTGTGSVTVSGTPPTGYDPFSSIGDTNWIYYGIVGQGTSEWEVGLGTISSSGTVLSRDKVFESSNSDALVNFSAGTKDVFCTMPASKVMDSGTMRGVLEMGRLGINML